MPLMRREKKKGGDENKKTVKRHATPPFIFSFLCSHLAVVETHFYQLLADHSLRVLFRSLAPLHSPKDIHHHHHHQHVRSLGTTYLLLTHHFHNY